VKRRIMLGTYVLSSGYYEAQYIRAQKVRTLIRQDFLKAFETVDILLTPTSPTTAFKIGAKIEDPLAMYLNDIYTVSANLAGIPGISIPCGFSKKNLPIGLQLLGPFFHEAELLQLAYAFESQHDFHIRHPSLS
jgi:aspartyl-tRNA(Asn)/glutamyl-tRNA(Gln) amidotransferase subunit A